MLFAPSPVDWALAQPLLRCRGGGWGPCPGQLPHLLQECTFPDIKCALLGDFLCSVAFCAEGEGRVFLDHQRTIKGCRSFWGKLGCALVVMPQAKPATFAPHIPGSARLQ